MAVLPAVWGLAIELVASVGTLDVTIQLSPLTIQSSPWWVGDSGAPTLHHPSLIAPVYQLRTPPHKSPSRYAPLKQHLPFLRFAVIPACAVQTAGNQLGQGEHSSAGLLRHVGLLIQHLKTWVQVKPKKNPTTVVQKDRAKALP